MKDKDYQKLVEEYGKLHEERPDLYPLTLEDVFDVHRRQLDKVMTKDTGFAEKINLILRMAHGDDDLLKLCLAFKKKDMEYQEYN